MKETSGKLSIEWDIKNEENVLWNCLLHILLNRYYVSFNMRWKGSFKIHSPQHELFFLYRQLFLFLPFLKKEPQQQSKIKLLYFYHTRIKDKKKYHLPFFCLLLWKFILYMFRLWLLFHTYAPKYHTSLNRKWMCHDVFTSMHKPNYKHVDFL